MPSKIPLPKSGRVLAEGHQTMVLAATGGTKAPQSPGYFDRQGTVVRSMTVESQNAVRIELWHSINMDNPLNQAQIDEAAAYGLTPPEPVLTHIKWSYVGELLVPEPGTHPVSPSILAALNRGRYCKFDPTHGSTTGLLLHIYCS